MKQSRNPCGFYKTLQLDFSAIPFKDRRRPGFLAMLHQLFMRPGFLAVFLYRLSAAFFRRGGRFGRILARIVWRLNVFLTACDIEPEAKIGAGFTLPHPMGIVIGEVMIGENVEIFQNVTLGLRRFDDANVGVKKYPDVGDHVIICSGAVVVGDVMIGSGSIIGAGAVIIDNVPGDSVAVGNPARILPRKKDAASHAWAEQEAAS
jgi:serine O-acetyltransferase